MAARQATGENQRRGASRRRVDVGRADRIVRAAVNVIREQGVVAVSHRSVAERARVPLGSTTYYFRSLDDLLEQALKVVIDDFRERIAAWVQTADRSDPAAAIAAFLDSEHTEAEGKVLRSDFDLFAASIYRPGLRPMAREWVDAVVDGYSELIPRSAAMSVNGMVESYQLRRIIEDRELTAEESEAVRRHIRAIVEAETP